MSDKEKRNLNANSSGRIESQAAKKPLVIISGPTAVGKTDISIGLAKSIHGQIISADSMQVYKGFDIGTAKITRREMDGVKHYLIDELEPEEEFNVFEFQQRTKQYIDQILAQGCIPIIVGGTGFYIQSVLYDIAFAPSHESREYREYLEQIAKEQGAAALHKMLAEADPESAAQIHENNLKRTIRALEFHHETGGSMAVHNEEQRHRESDYRFAYFVLNRQRSEIYRRIDLRVDQMMETGLVEEVQGLLKKGIPRNCLSMQGLGYKEIAAYLCGEISLDEAVRILKRDTRHFAKRQLTWFRRERDITWVNYEDFASRHQMMEYMLEVMQQRGIIPKTSL